MSQYLLVEGNDDSHVIWSLLEKHKVDENFSVLDKKGIEKLLQVLPVQLKSSGVKSVGVVIDADVNIAGRWASLRSIASRAGYTKFPDEPLAGGTIVEEEGMPRLGAWLMPDNTASGMLEDFAAFLIPGDDKLLARARSALQAIPPDDKRFVGAHDSKALIHTWLAWQEDPGTPMGLAITKKYLDGDCEKAVEFSTWMSKLFRN
ncbi:DUF3226 domain-containing protein [Caulobacter sp. FWC2]|uniref:DUF3226 domain-containing protein n=1 Tax=Caulobacter sp. FWC2 TaxID=69664 RepID=UPI001178BF4A|nr:DUF3226 domain-containing protein [Caulobacter sp. FWC2]